MADTGYGPWGGAAVPDEVLDATPTERAAAALAALGPDVLLTWCAALLGGSGEWGDPERPDPGWVGGRAARTWGHPGRIEGARRSWARTWAARTLLHAWRPDADAGLDDVVVDALLVGLSDDAWRVREMCAKVVTAGEVGAAARACRRLAAADVVPRVRAAAVRAVGVVGEGEDAPVVHGALRDPDAAVRAAADRALARLRTRLDRDV